jgi:LruC domain-containing protein
LPTETKKHRCFAQAKHIPSRSKHNSNHIWQLRRLNAGDSIYFNTDPHQTPSIPDTAKFTLTFSGNDAAYFYPDFYNYRTSKRGRQTHLAGFSGTSEANASLYKTFDGVNGTYKTASGLPWAMEFILESDDFYQ